jgi:hypothetical protein
MQTQTECISALLATMTAAQRAALLDVLGSHVENVEADCEEEGDTSGLPEFDQDGHSFIVAFRDATINAIAAQA